MITAQAEEIKKAFISAVRFDGLVRLGVEPGEIGAKRGRATAALGVGWATFRRRKPVCCHTLGSTGMTYQIYSADDWEIRPPEMKITTTGLHVFRGTHLLYSKTAVEMPYSN